MRTISEIYRDRLVAEADEADNLQLTKLAENITRQVEKTPVREANASYTYAASDFRQDIQDSLWDLVIRTADFHGAYISSEKAQSIVDYYGNEIVDNIRKAAGISSDIGSYEPKLPGEIPGSVMLDIEK
jgi:hypothetical protein